MLAQKNMSCEMNGAKVVNPMEKRVSPKLRWILPVLEEVEICLQSNKHSELSKEIREIRNKILSKDF